MTPTASTTALVLRPAADADFWAVARLFAELHQFNAGFAPSFASPKPGRRCSTSIFGRLTMWAAAQGFDRIQLYVTAANTQEEAAGLPLLAANPVVLAHHIAIRIPAPCDAATFYAYVLGEQTPVRWLPALRPLHYAAIRADGVPNGSATADCLARVLLVPVGPDDTAEELKHAGLGITKAADYLGVRWTTDPARAAWYAELMTACTALITMPFVHYASTHSVRVTRTN